MNAGKDAKAFFGNGMTVTCRLVFKLLLHLMFNSLLWARYDGPKVLGDVRSNTVVQFTWSATGQDFDG